VRACCTDGAVCGVGWRVRLPDLRWLCGLWCRVAATPYPTYDGCAVCGVGWRLRLPDLRWSCGLWYRVALTLTRPTVSEVLCRPGKAQPPPGFMLPKPRFAGRHYRRQRNIPLLYRQRFYSLAIMRIPYRLQSVALPVLQRSVIESPAHA